MHLNGWLDTLIQTGGDVASNIFKPTASSSFPMYTPPMFPTAPQYPQQPSGSFLPSSVSQASMLMLVAAGAVGVYLLTRKRGR
jgi:hypothetical protein